MNNFKFSKIVRKIFNSKNNVSNCFHRCKYVESMEFDSETLHGTHYTVEEFDAKVNELYQEYIESKQRLIDTIDPTLKESLLKDFRRQVYLEWNWCSIDQYALHEVINSVKYDRMRKLCY